MIDEGRVARASEWCYRNKRMLLRAGVTLLVFVAVVGVAALSWWLAGPIATILYAFLFVLGATLVPTAIMLFGSAMPAALGKLEFALGQLAFGSGWLVQHDHGWEMHPGRSHAGVEQVWIDGVWRDVPDSAHQTILGWQQFGILLNKTSDRALKESRVEGQCAVDVNEQTEQQLSQLGVSVQRAQTDGGQSGVTRAGIDEVEMPTREPGDQSWIVDLKRFWSRGLEKMGDIGLIEKQEEVTMRQEAADRGQDPRRTVMGSVAGLVLGVATGYVIMVGF